MSQIKVPKKGKRPFTGGVNGLVKGGVYKFLFRNLYRINIVQNYMPYIIRIYTVFSILIMFILLLIIYIFM